MCANNYQIWCDRDLFDLRASVQFVTVFSNASLTGVALTGALRALASCNACEDAIIDAHARMALIKL